MFRCEACGVELPEARREAHLAYWCAALESDSEGSDEAGSVLPTAPAPAAFLHDSTSTRALSVTVPTLSCAFQFEQLSIFGELSTGAALWYSEVVMAEWMARQLSAGRTSTIGTAKSGAHARSRPRVLELGCGAVPLAGLVCVALGCDVLLADLAPVLRHAEANVRRNHALLATLRRRADSASAAACSAARCDAASISALSRTCIDTVELRFGEPLPSRVHAMGPFEFVLCSDCLFRQDMHGPLASTLRALLVGPQRVCRRSILSFQPREDATESAFFGTACPNAGLQAAPVDVSDVIASAPWRRAATAAAAAAAAAAGGATTGTDSPGESGHCVGPKTTAPDVFNQAGHDVLMYEIAAQDRQ